jgi:hypothetical protein
MDAGKCRESVQISDYLAQVPAREISMVGHHGISLAAHGLDGHAHKALNDRWASADMPG